MPATVRIGIIGSGYMGRTYAECLAHYNSGTRLVAVAGGTRAAPLAADYGIAAESSVDNLLQRSDIDAVIITSPQLAHREHTIAAARAGKHVMVEKPMATSVSDCRDMIDACRSAGVALSVIKPWRYRGATRGLYRALHEDDRIGPPRMLSLWWHYPRRPFVGKDWFRDPKQGGFFLDAGCHCFDYLRWIARSEPTRLYASLTTFGESHATPQSSMTQITFANGILAQLWLSYEVPPPGWENTDFRARVVGERGELDAHGYGALQLGANGGWETLYVQPPIDYVNKPMERNRLEAFFDMTQDFIDAVAEGRQPPVSGEDGLAAVAMVEAGYRSQEQGQSVELTPA